MSEGATERGTQIVRDDSGGLWQNRHTVGLVLGTHFGPYEVIGLLGVGGMGEVYRARDTRLKREVALKVLPAAFASDPERLARFQREAEVLASLNHPNIAAIHGLEDADRLTGQGHATMRALVLELVEGPTLADRIARGPVPVEEALSIARQIAEALDSAHERGVVHRDLKPANIKVRDDGTVKVLDFGLAKAMEIAEPRGQAYVPVSQAPTITTPAMTRAGVILGTAAYMAPEQARGKPVDKRADIWAFACILFEMITGRQAFDGDDVTIVMANIVKSDPDWAALPAETPAAVRGALRACLQKEPTRRIRDIADARLALEGGLSDEMPTASHRLGASNRRRRFLQWAAAFAGGGIIVGSAAWAPSDDADVLSEPLKRFTLSVPADVQLPTAAGSLLAISPDGETVVYRGRSADGFRLYRRRMNSMEASALAEDEPEDAFFSQDGSWVAYVAGNTLKKVPTAGGPSQTVTTVPGNPRGGTWSADDVMFVGGGVAGLLRIPAVGGQPEVIVSPASGRQVWYPSVVPGNRAVVFTHSENRPDSGTLELLVLGTGERRTLLEGAAGRVLPSGHLVFVRGGTLWAAAFDLDSLAVLGNPRPFIEGIRVETGGAVQYAVADDGTIVYLGSVTSVPVWVSRDGTESAINIPAPPFRDPSLSPDGQRLALASLDQGGDIWTFDLMRGGLMRHTSNTEEDETPVWSADGEWIAWSATRGRERVVFRRRADGSGPEERLWGTPLPVHIHVTQWSNDRRALLLEYSDGTGSGRDLVVLSTDGEANLAPLLRTTFDEAGARLSGDGRWLAYSSDESGREEVYVQPYPAMNRKWQMSTGGGSQPRWSPRQDELLYRGEGALISVRLSTTPTFAAERPLKLFADRFTDAGSSRTAYDVGPNEEQLLMIREVQDANYNIAPQVNVVLNWLGELRGSR